MPLQSRPLSGWHPAEVKAAIQMRGATLSGLARANGFSESFLRMTLRRPSYIGEQIIAGFLGVKAHVIWPDRYVAPGKPAYRAKRPLRRLRRVA